MRNSNWPNGWDLSHPNWTSKTPSRSEHKLHTPERPPSLKVQVGLGLLVIVAFMAGMFAL